MVKKFIKTKWTNLNKCIHSSACIISGLIVMKQAFVHEYNILFKEIFKLIENELNAFCVI